MAIIAQILFTILTITALYLFGKNLLKIRRNILIGKAGFLNDQKARRWKNVFLLALGQKKMFKKPIVAILHLILYVGFIIINIELLEIMADGVLGTHRIFETYFEQFGLASLYNFIINSFEILAALVFVACIIFFGKKKYAETKKVYE